MRVKVTILVTETDDDACSAMGVFRAISVRLSEPLGDRHLVDGGTS